MALRTLIIETEPIASCNAGETELQQGEEVNLRLSGTNHLWPDQVRATVALTAINDHDRTYTFTYEESELLGGPLLNKCDVSEIRCFSCCDANFQILQNLISVLPVTQNEDGTFTYNP